MILMLRTKSSPKAEKIQSPFFYVPSDDGTDENLLILLHGLGRTKLSNPERTTLNLL